MPLYRRAGISAKLLQVLRIEGSTNDARLAYHAEVADDHQAVLVYAPRAGARAAQMGAHREAVAQYQRALRHAVGDIDERLVSRAPCGCSHAPGPARPRRGWSATRRRAG